MATIYGNQTRRYAEHPQHQRPGGPRPASSLGQNEPAPPANPRPAKKRNTNVDEQISFVLEKEGEVEEEEDEVNEKVQKLEKPFIRTSARATILHLKKFLKKKLELGSPDDVDILCQGQIMGREYTLEFIRKSCWRAEAEQLKLVYRQKVDYDDMANDLPTMDADTSGGAEKGAGAGGAAAGSAAAAAGPGAGAGAGGVDAGAASAKGGSNPVSPTPAPA
jgi:hypothetical protein